MLLDKTEICQNSLGSMTVWCVNCHALYSEFLSACGRTCGRSDCGQAMSNRLAPPRRINWTTLLSLCYRYDIMKPFFKELTYIDCGDGYFQQDSATSHTVNELIREFFLIPGCQCSHVVITVPRFNCFRFSRCWKCVDVGGHHFPHHLS